MNLRLLALAGIAACAVALPLAVASAGSVGDEGRSAVRTPVPDALRDSARDVVSDAAPRDDKATSAGPARSPLLLGLGLATAARCGPDLSSPDGIEAQTCVLTQGED